MFVSSDSGSFGVAGFIGNIVLSKVLSILSITLFNKACIALSTFSPVFALVSKYMQLWRKRQKTKLNCEVWNFEEGSEQWGSSLKTKLLALAIIDDKLQVRMVFDLNNACVSPKKRTWARQVPHETKPESKYSEIGFTLNF